MGYLTPGRSLLATGLDRFADPASMSQIDGDGVPR
jgi:hypothetical protein